MQNARAHKIQWSGSTVHSFTVTWRHHCCHSMSPVLKAESFVIYRGICDTSSLQSTEEKSGRTVKRFTWKGGSGFQYAG